MTHTGLASIEALNSQYQITVMTPVFPTLKAKQLATGKMASALYADIQAKFPQRTQRAPRDGTLPVFTHIYTLKLKEPDADILAVCAAYQQDPHVEWCQPNYQMTIQWVPNDPYYSSSNAWGQGYEDLWGLKQLTLEPAWDRTRGAGIVVAVVDTGVDYTHPDIAPNVWINPREDRNPNGVDDDANGYIDDIRGFDFGNSWDENEDGDYADPNDINDPDPMDALGHGTHVAGTIAAVGDNNLGIVGVAPDATVMALKTFYDAVGYAYVEDLARALVYATDNGADVINNSWGCAEPCPSDPLLEAAVTYAYNSGAVVVFAAGNESMDVALFSPQNMTNPKPIVVAATDHTDGRADFSNYGELIDVAAPGGDSGNMEDTPSGSHFYVNILSLRAATTDMYVGTPNYTQGEFVLGGSFYRARGTSMAAPHVSGLAALILAHRPTFTNEEVRQVLRLSADDAATPGWDFITGAGRINATTALTIESVPKVQWEIREPEPGTTIAPLDGPVKIRGTAAGEDFTSYQVFVGQGPFPTTWNSLGAPVHGPVINGLLGTWVIQDLSEDLYLIRLVVTSTSGLQYEELVPVEISKARPLITDLADQISPSISEHWVVWEDEGLTSVDPVQVTLYDLETSRTTFVGTPDSSCRVTEESFLSPSITSNRIAWQQLCGTQQAIELYDLNTTMRQRITSLDNTTWREAPAISDRLVVWQQDRVFSSTLWDIGLYGLANTSEQLINLAEVQWHPHVSGTKIVWEHIPQGGRSQQQLFFCDYDLTQGGCSEQGPIPFTFTKGRYPISPRISGNRIVWAERNTSVDWEIVLCDLEKPAGESGYCFNEATHQPITSNPAPQWSAAISGNRIVWVDERLGNPDIFMCVYDPTAGTCPAEPVTTHPSRQEAPAIEGDRVVWMDDRRGNWDIYFRDLVNQSPELQAIGDRTVEARSTVTITVKATDPDFDRLVLSASSLPKGARFNTRTGVFTWTPTGKQHGAHSITFSVSDGELTDSEMIAIHVQLAITGSVKLVPSRSPISGCTVTLYGNKELTQVLAEATTDNDGAFRFQRNPGTYWVKPTQFPSGITVTNPPKAKQVKLKTSSKKVTFLVK